MTTRQELINIIKSEVKKQILENLSLSIHTDTCCNSIFINIIVYYDNEIITKDGFVIENEQ